MKRMALTNSGKRMLIVSILLTLLLLDAISCENHKHRVRRRIVFSKNSKLFFRINGKVNVIPWVQIFAHGWAVRVNWDLPDTLQRRHKFFKRDLEADIQNLESIQGTKGYSCILNSICRQVEYISSSGTCGVFCELGRIINESDGVESEFLKSILTNCPSFESTCNSIDT